LKLVLSCTGNFPDAHKVYFDEIKIDKWVFVNNTDPNNPNPPPSKVDSDGFPAQALQAYWILKDKGYTDDNIFFMLYHTNDNEIDIYKNDGITNDLTDAIIDVENDDVNSTRLKKELNVSISGSFASGLHAEDQLILYLIDHGSNKQLGDGNATYQFESDQGMLSEFEFYNLIKVYPCVRMLICIDFCFSGNFLNNQSMLAAN